MLDFDPKWRENPKFQMRVNSLGQRIFPVYYAMVPERDPMRDGKEWYLRERASTPDKQWKQEREIDFGAASGGLIYPHFDIRRDVLVQPVPLRKHWDYAIAIDPGVTVTAALFSCLTEKGIVFHIAEYYEGASVGAKEALSATVHAENIIRRAQDITDSIYGRDRDNGRSVMPWDKLFKTQLLDQSSWRRELSGEDLGSTAQRFIDAGFYDLEKATKDIPGGIQRVLQWERRSIENEHPNLGVKEWADPAIGWPTKFAFPGLTHYISEKIHYHYGDDGETPADKQMDHLCDDERYILVHFRDNPSLPKEVAPVKTAYDIELEYRMRSPKQRGRLCLPKKRVWE